MRILTIIALAVVLVTGVPALQNVAAQETHANAADADGHAEAKAENPNPLVFDPDLAIFTAIVFLLLLAVLGKYAWPTIAIAMEVREQKIADNIAAAEAKHEEAKSLLVAHQAKLAGAADEVRALLEEARRDAEHTKAQIIDEAKKAASDEAQRAVREVEQAKEAALHDLATKSADAAIELAGKVVRERIDPNRQAEIIREALSKLAATTPSDN